MPYIIAAIAAALVVLMTWRFLPETIDSEHRAANRKRKNSDPTIGEMIANVPLVGILLVTFGAQFAFAMLQSTFSLYGEAVIFRDQPEIAAIGVGLLLAMVGVGQIFTQAALIRPMVSRFGEGPLVLIGGALRGLAFVGVVLFVSPWVVAAILFLFAVGSGLQQPALQALVTNTVSDEMRGSILGVFQSVTNLAIIGGSAIAGALFEVSPESPYVVGAGVFAVMLIPSYFLSRWARKQKRGGDFDQPAPHT